MEKANKKSFRKPYKKEYRTQVPTLDKNTRKIVEYIIKNYPLYKIEKEGGGKKYFFTEENLSVTENMAVHKTNHNDRIEAVEYAFNQIPIEYRRCVYEHLINNKKYKYIDTAHSNTIYKYCKVFIYFVARKLGEI